MSITAEKRFRIPILLAPVLQNNTIASDLLHLHFHSECHYQATAYYHGRAFISLLAPGPLLINSHGRCITYQPSNLQLVLASSCNETMFYYDGEHIREATTHQCIWTTGIENYSKVQSVRYIDISHAIWTYFFLLDFLPCYSPVLVNSN